MTPELRNWYLSNLGIVQYVPKGEEPVTLQFHSSQVVAKSEAASNSVNSPASRVKSQVASVLEMMEVKAAVPPAVEKIVEKMCHNPAKIFKINFEEFDKLKKM